MKTLRVIRIMLALLFLGASVAAVVMGSNVHPAARLAEKSQIILSSISITAGATMVWLLLSFVFGRIYCSSACPVGTISDIAMKCRRFAPERLRKPLRYRHASKATVHILWVYVACLLFGIVGFPYLVEPWNMMRNVAALVNADAVNTTWLNIGMSAIVGAVGGVVAILLIIALSVRRGRQFCTDFCPVGAILGHVSKYALYHVEIDRDRCTSCGICEDICRSGCIKTVSRYVDDSRCVRCLDCMVKCPENAIRLQVNRNRPATPLMTRTKKIRN